LIKEGKASVKIPKPENFWDYLPNVKVVEKEKNPTILNRDFCILIELLSTPNLPRKLNK
jgi:hypothetical protein